MPMRSCRAVASRRESNGTDSARGQRTSHSQRAQATTHSLHAHARATPSVSDGRRRCSHGVSAVWPCVAPPTWSRSQDTLAESPSRRVGGRAPRLTPSGTAGETHRRTLPGGSPHRETIGELSLDRGARSRDIGSSPRRYGRYSRNEVDRRSYALDVLHSLSHRALRRESLARLKSERFTRST